MSRKAKDVGQYIVNFFIKRDTPICNSKLQKLLYFSWVDYHQLINDLLFEEEFIAWPMEPIVLSVYYDFCAFGAESIFRFKEVKLTNIDEDILIESLHLYGEKSLCELVDLSKKKDGPWDRVYMNGEGGDKALML